MTVSSRPLVGEPIAMDLINTRWVSGGTRHDLLDGPTGLARWLTEAGLGTRFDADPAALPPLLRARDAIAVLVAAPDDPGATAELNAILEHGTVRRTLAEGAPRTAVAFDAPAWGPAWTAADGYLDLLAAPDRIRRCAHPDCVLYFYDTSKNGTRRWCSMAGCGNRAKAARHHARERTGRGA
ncbi:CGNR zinc finger domain-containing protein [Nocardiopsis sp. N85]|uniref:CGNR zinc finger domain-containing protein n=1 Tax=Nocardiopsis sp. N85 TaxID=3029400 RepID=UPI00237FD1EE|nr:CGNR zinc finger domain-containing protein [Nocardiopsis sp. N85]MDE3720434.1 CGNR zinc finger domain-containing protein [Nocardiopsis sp. N85]